MPIHYLIVLLVALLATVLPGSVAAAYPEIPQGYVRAGSLRNFERIEGLAGLENVGQVAEGIYRGGQPAAPGYAALKGLGIGTVISLEPAPGEQAEVEAAGMRYVEIPVDLKKKGSRAKVDLAVALMTDPANRPVYVHCRQGVERTGIVVAAYRLKVLRWPQADAEAELTFFGLNDDRGVFMKFIRQYGNDVRKRR